MPVSSITHNPLLQEISSIEGAKYRIDRLIYQELQSLLHISDADWVKIAVRAGQRASQGA